MNEILSYGLLLYAALATYAWYITARRAGTAQSMYEYMNQEYQRLAKRHEGAERELVRLQNVVSRVYEATQENTPRDITWVSGSTIPYPPDTEDYEGYIDDIVR